MTHPFSRISLRARILLTYMSIILLGFTGITLIAGGQISAAVRADYTQRLQNEIRLVGHGLGSLIDSNASEAEIQEALTSYEQQIGARLALYQEGDQRPPEGATDRRRDSFYKRPELETALRGETVLVERPDENGQATFYTAAPIGRSNYARGLVQLAVPVSVLQGVVMGRWVVLLAVFGLITSVAVLATWSLSQSIIRPLGELRESAVKLSRGDLTHRIRLRRQDELGQVARTFNEMADQVQRMIEEQRAFASNTAHELRTPLTALRLRTEALCQDPDLDPETARRYIEELDREIAGLGDLVQDLTLLSRFDAGRAEVGQDEIDFTRLATNLVQKSAPQAHEKAIQIHVEHGEEPLLVTASLTHLSVVFRNLLDNALKYTPNGGKITWRMKADPDGINHILQDTGQGIDAQHLPHIFERFYRGDKARSRATPGTGLGLALVKSILDTYGAKISVTSPGVGQGTTVTVFWPFAQPGKRSQRWGE